MTFLVSGGFGCRVHAVLGDFVDPASRRLNALAVEMVEGDAAFADGVAFFDGLGDVGFGKGGGFEQGAGGGELRGDGGGERAARAVGVVGFYLVAAELDHFRAVEQDIDGAFHVTAFDDDSAGAHLYDFAGGGFHVGDVFDGEAGENFGFGNVGSDDAGALQQFRRDIFDSAGVEEFGAAGRFHDRVVDDVREFVGIEKFADDNGVAAITEHADFYGGDVAVFREDFELFAEFGARSIVCGFNSLGVLHRERCDRRNAVAAMGGESL